MKANIEKVLSFLIELARLFLAWKKGENRVRGMGYRGEKKPNPESPHLPPNATAKVERVRDTGYGVQGGEKTTETEVENCLARGEKGTGKSGKSRTQKVSKTAEAVSPHTPIPPYPHTPKDLFSAHDADSAVPGGDGDSAGSNRGAALATGERVRGTGYGVRGGEKNPEPKRIGYRVQGTGYGEEKDPQTPDKETPDGVSPRTPYPVPRTPLNILGWGLMLYAGLRLLSRL